MSDKSKGLAETAKQIQTLLRHKRSSGPAYCDPRSNAAILDELRRVLTTAYAECQDVDDKHHDSEKSAISKWKAFLKTCIDDLVAQLSQSITKNHHQLLLSSTRTFWGVLAGVPARSNAGYSILNCQLLKAFLLSISSLDVEQLHDKQLRHMLTAEFFGPYRDVQYYSMITIAEIANDAYNNNNINLDNNNNKSKKRPKKGSVAENLVELLIMIPMASSQKELDRGAHHNSIGHPLTTTGSGGYLFEPPDSIGKFVAKGGHPNDDDDDDDDSEEDESEESDGEFGSEDDEDSSSVDASEDRPNKRVKTNNNNDSETPPKKFAFQEYKQHRVAWTKAWLAVLRLPLSESSLKKVLQFIPDAVLPVATTPLRFADFFMNAYSSNTTSAVPILALQGLFLLMMKHGLEYPEFYKQLYKLIMSPSLFFLKNRTNFCRLLDNCLSRNQMLPAHIVAAFMKRLVRNALSSPPSSCMFILALTSNLIRKHPETACLIHRKMDDNEGIEDGFDESTDDPEQTNALQSSLWELGALEKHYYPAVATLAQSIGREEEIQTPLHDMENFVSGHTYGTLFEVERNRRKRRNEKTPLTFHKPSGLFVENDIFHGILSVPR
jgi:U3 small nucleolar RNA-associated protein 19